MRLPIPFLAAALLLFFSPAARAAADDAAVRGLIGRIAPGHADDFVLETIPAPPGKNAFEVEAGSGGSRGKIVLRGDGPLSQAVAFHWYLQHDAHASVSWYADEPVVLPQRLPLPAGKARRETRLRDRFFLNYCTFGYTLPYWHWRDWERGIDWMALHGINLPLAQTGNEYVWQKVWRGYGLSDDEIRAFFTGPAHLPWHRMANIDRWQGPLPQSFIDGQYQLQQRILARERALGMSPVLCAFAGHVPEALHTHRPGLRIARMPNEWAGFTSEETCWFLDPHDPAFHEIAVRFQQEQARAYGPARFYGADPFNEMTPPSWEPAYLAGVARAIYRGIADAEPGATWLQMAWTFHNDRHDWTDARLRAMIDAVPRGRMELIDYYCERDEFFRQTEAFFGAPFLWSYLGNFGGNTVLVAPLDRIDRLLGAAMRDRSLANLAGVGATLEGFSNPAAYDLLYDRVWEGDHLDLDRWMRDEARARAGGPDPACEEAWDLLRRKVLTASAFVEGHGGVFQMTEPALRAAAADPNLGPAYANADLFRAWGLLLQAGPRARQADAWQQDVADLTRQALSNLGLARRDEMFAAYQRKDPAAFRTASRRFLELGRDLDGFLGARGEFLLGKWIADARSWGDGAAEQDYFERNARTIVTTWGGGLTDYAGRQWNGLLRDYYLPRWQMLIDATQSELEGGAPVDRQALAKQWRAHDQAFAATAGGAPYPSLPSSDLFAESQALHAKYAPPAHRKE